MTLAEIAYRLGRKALDEVANVARPDTVLGWYRKLMARKFVGFKSRCYPGRPSINDAIEQFARLLHEGGYTILFIYRHFNHLCNKQRDIFQLQLVPKIQILGATSGLGWAGREGEGDSSHPGTLRQLL